MMATRTIRSGHRFSKLNGHITTVGVIYDWTQVWDYALILLVILAVVKLVLGLPVGKDRKI